jgi:hypothetical protein
MKDNETIAAWMGEQIGKLRFISGTHIGLGDVSVSPGFLEDLVERSSEIEKEKYKVTGSTSDGYHTFDELYEFRKAYNAALFNEWSGQGKYKVHKSKRHHDGNLCFDGGWFIVVAVLPDGQVSNHYEMKDWGLFKVVETEKALFEFDGHIGEDVIKRLLSL